MKNFSLALSALVLSLALAACGGGATTPSAPPAVSVSSITGTVQNWTGDGSVVATANGADVSASLSTNGQFNLSLPDSAAVEPFLTPLGSAPINESGCTGSFTSSDPQAQGYSVSNLEIDQNSTFQKSINSVSTTVKQDTSTRVVVDATGSLWFYVDRPTHLGGSVTCSEVSSGVKISLKLGMNANLATGWNLIDMKAEIVATAAATANTVNMTLNFTNSADHTTDWSSDGDTYNLLSAGARTQVTALNKTLKSLRFFR